MLNLPNTILEQLREEYPSGARVRLLKMDDKQAPPIGTFGTVYGVDDTGSLLMKWDNGSSLNVIYGEDEVEKVQEEPIWTPEEQKRLTEAVNLLREGAAYGIFTMADENSMMIQVTYEDGTPGWEQCNFLECAIDFSKQPDSVWDLLRERIKKAQEVETVYEIRLWYDGHYSTPRYKAADVEQAVIMLKNEPWFNPGKEYRILSVQRVEEVLSDVV